MTLIIIFSSR